MISPSAAASAGIAQFTAMNVEDVSSFDEGNMAEILAFLAQDLLEKKPEDPILHMIESVLTFPFAGTVPAPTTSASSTPSHKLPPILPPNLCKKCTHSRAQTNFSHYAPTDVRPCCVYELRNNFSSSSSDFMSTLASFFNSSDSVMIIVGNDVEGPAKNSRPLPPIRVAQQQQQAESSGGCDCSGSGKSRLRRWLTFPGRYIHRRKVLVVNSSNVDGLVEFLGTVDSNPTSARERHLLSRMSAHSASATASPLTASRKLASFTQHASGPRGGGGLENTSTPQEVLGSAEPTLTLIEGIEPPHSIIHALMSRNFFRAERFATCFGCGVSVESAIHKTIVFTRPGVFFKFPIAAPIYTLVRQSQVSQLEEAAALSAQNAIFSASFTNIICEKAPELSAGSSAAAVGSIGVPTKSPPVSPTTSPRDSVIRGPDSGTNKQRKRRPFFANEGGSLNATNLQFESMSLNSQQRPLPLRMYKESPEVLTSTCIRLIYRELCHFYEHLQYASQPEDASRAISFSLDVSPTFSKLNTSRSRIEIALAAHMIDRCLIPTFDMSEFPNLLVCIVLQPRSDVYISRYLDRVVNDLKKAILPSRIVIGNLLCLVSASQQCASPYTPPATASDLLQLYLDAFIGQAAAIGGATPRSYVSTPRTPMSISGTTTGGGVNTYVAGAGGGSSMGGDSTTLGISQQQQTLMTLDIQNLVIENFQVRPNRAGGGGNKVVLVSHCLLDARGTDIAPELLQFLVRGTTLQGYLKSQTMLTSQHQPQALQQQGDSSGRTVSPSFQLLSSQNQVVSFLSPTSESPGAAGPDCFPNIAMASRQQPQPLLDHPVQLLSDITEVGRGGFEGHGTSSAPRLQAFSSVLHCFLAKLANDGIAIIIIVEKNTVIARTSFADPDTQAEATPSSTPSLNASRVAPSEFDGTSSNAASNILWTLHFSAKKAIKSALLLTENVPICAHDRGINHDVLLLVHTDASCSVISINDVPQGAHVMVQRALGDDTMPAKGFMRRQASITGRTNSFQMTRTDSNTATVSTATTTVTPMDGGLHKASSASALRRLSQISNNSRIIADIPIMQLPSAEDLCEEVVPTNTDDDDAQLGDLSFITIIDSATLRCDDPYAMAISPSYIAGCNQDSDLVVVIKNPFTNLNAGSSYGAFPTQQNSEEEKEDAEEKFFQADGNVTAIVICNDILVVGLETGDIQSFGLESGKEIATMEHHEGGINVLRNMTKPPQVPSRGAYTSASFSFSTSGSTSAPPATSQNKIHNYFIAGAEDATITVWSTTDNQLVRTLRHHENAVVDICAANVFQNRIIVSCDRSGLLTVVSLNPDDMREPWQILWMSNFTSLRHLSLAASASWLVCSRHQQVPIAMPIAQWAIRGNGQFHRKPISVLHISSSEQYLFTGGEDGVIFVWRLNAKMNFVLCFRQHASNSTITSISTNSDESRVASADNKKFIYIWSIKSHVSEAPKMIDRGGGGFVKFVAMDYLVVQTRKGVKVMDPDLKLVTSSNNTLADGAIDVYVASETEYEECFADIVCAKPAQPQSQSPAGPDHKSRFLRAGAVGSESSNSGGDEDDGAASPGTVSNPLSSQCSPTIPHPPPDILFPQIILSGNGSSGNAGGTGSSDQMLVDVSMTEGASPPLSRRCFIAVCRGGSGDKFTIPIYTAESLAKSTPCLELWRGDVEDEFGDEEEVLHTDSIKMFVFLQNRETRSSLSSSSLAIPNLHLAASAGDDLIVILWNWRKQEPLCSLQHSQFVNAISFLSPSMASHRDYPPADMTYLRKKHPSFADQDLLVGRLVTCQDADSTNGTTIRVFSITENPRSFQKRFLMQRCGQPVTTVTFDYKMLQTTEVSTSKSSNTESMPRCIVVRNTDGLVVTGHDNSNEVVFWKWLPERPALTSSAVANVVLSTSSSFPRREVVTPPADSGSTPPSPPIGFESEDSDDDNDRDREVERTTMCLRPLRRLVSRV